MPWVLALASETNEKSPSPIVIAKLKKDDLEIAIKLQWSR